MKRRALNDFNWERTFSNKNDNKKVCIFIKSVLNDLSNFVAHEAILYNDKNPLWFNSLIKSLLQVKNKVFKNKRKNFLQTYSSLKFLHERLNSLITKSKNNYYECMANKLNNLQINPKPYWSLLKCFSNKKYP